MLAVLISALASIGIGFLWYGPLFKGAWMKVIGMEHATPIQEAMMKKQMFGLVVSQFVMSLITTYVLAKFMSMTGTTGVTTAFWVWFGFVMPIIGAAAIWSGKPRAHAWMMFIIMSGCQLITFLVYGFILGVWH